MIIQTRFRDIEQPEHETYSDWSIWRGKPVLIEVPASEPRNWLYPKRCDGPYFRVVGQTHPSVKDATLWVCGHVAEIGD